MFFRRDFLKSKDEAERKFVVASYEPSYRALGPEGLRRRASRAWQLASPCQLCAHRCQIDRWEGATGICRTGRRAIVSSYGPHFGEEPPITGLRGSGTIFFAGCNLQCKFCQNYQIAHFNEGREVDDRELASIMISLQRSGCHNINLVTPSHVVPQILSALSIAVSDGLNIPLVYNTGGYDPPDTLDILSGVIDIYMPDMKFGSDKDAVACTLVSDYTEVNFKAVQKMHKQVGDLKLNHRGIAVRGLLVRHLVLPGDLAGTAAVMKFIAEKISPDTYINIMDQYYPCHEAVGHPVLGRRITGSEFDRALKTARGLGLNRLQR